MEATDRHANTSVSRWFPHSRLDSQRSRSSAPQEIYDGGSTESGAKPDENIKNGQRSRGGDDYARGNGPLPLDGAHQPACLARQSAPPSPILARSVRDGRSVAKSARNRSRHVFGFRMPISPAPGGHTSSSLPRTIPNDARNQRQCLATSQDAIGARGVSKPLPPLPTRLHLPPSEKAGENVPPGVGRGALGEQDQPPVQPIAGEPSMACGYKLRASGC
jgi:hypothetical protein